MARSRPSGGDPRPGREGAHTPQPGAGSRRSPQQARSAQTRRRLLDAGFAAFAAKGHDGVNLVEDVLEPAGISIGSFYHQFADKTELLQEILAEAAERRRAFIVELGTLDPAAGLDQIVRTVIERLYDTLERDTEAWRLQRVTRVTGADGVRAMGATREAWDAPLAQLLGGWFDAPPDRLRRAADLLVTMARGFVSDVLDTPPAGRRDRAETVDAMTAFALGGLTALLGTPRARD